VLDLEGRARELTDISQIAEVTVGADGYSRK